MKFIHAADIHLDSPFKGLKQIPAGLYQLIRQSTFQAFERLIDFALEQQVDFVLLVGDLYDQDAQSLKAEAFLNTQLNRLAEAKIPVYLSFGNHDFLKSQAQHFTYPTNVIVFGPKVETVYQQVGQQRVSITGFSYENRWVNEDLAQSFPSKTADVDYAIGMLHGGIAEGQQVGQSYAPFTLSELKQKQIDYWALGHIHKRAVLSEQPPIIYPGNLQGRHKIETGPKGFYLVTVDQLQTTYEFEETDQVQWKTVEVSVNDDATIQQVLAEIETALTTLLTSKNWLITLVLNGEKLNAETLERIMNGELLELLQNQTVTKAPYCFVNEIRYHATTQVVFSEIDQQFWEAAKEEVFKTINITELMRSLQKYDFLKDVASDNQFLSELSEDTTLQLQQFMEANNEN